MAFLAEIKKLEQEIGLPVQDLTKDLTIGRRRRHKNTIMLTKTKENKMHQAIP